MTFHGSTQIQTVLMELTWKYMKDVRYDAWCCFKIPKNGKKKLKKKTKGTDGRSDANVAVTH